VAWVVRQEDVPQPNANPALRFGLILVPLPGGEPRVVVEWERRRSVVGPALPTPAARRQVSPDGRRFVLATESRRIVLVDLETGSARQLTSDADFQDDSPVWSPDARAIAFRRSRGGLEAGIWSMGSDGTGLRRIVIGDPARVDPLTPVYDWSPDATAICYSEPLNEYRCVNVRDASHAFSDGNVADLAPADWRTRSPELVIAVSQRGAGASNLYATDLRRPGQSSTIASARAADAEFRSPRWHPTADEFVYVEVRSSGGARLGPSLALFVAVLGSAPRALGTGGVPREPEWSPDGEEVLYLGGESNTSPVNVAVFAARRTGTALRTVWLPRTASTLVSLATRRY